MRTTPGRIIVELDELASAMLRRVCREGSPIFHAGADPRDMVSAAVTYLLCEENDKVGWYHLNDSTGALGRARAARVALERKE